MIQKLIDFFKSLFAKDDGNTQPTNPNPKPPAPKPPSPPEPDPQPVDKDDELVADGSDLMTDPDSIGTIVFPEILEIDPPFVDVPAPPIPDIKPIEDAVVPPAEDEDDNDDTEDEDEPAQPEPPAHTAKYLWCLDNGHGKFTEGKRSPKFEDGTRFFEYEFNRDIVARIIKQLDETGVKYFNVVPEVDIDNFLQGRVDRANGHQTDLPKLFISIHANAAPTDSADGWANAKGAETWYYQGSSRGRKLASIFQKHIINYTGMVNRGLKSTKGLYVIKNTSMPAALTENGFFNHKLEAQELMKNEVRQLIADAHVAAILEIEEGGL